MKILLAEHFGICFGVRDAISNAVQLAAEAPLTVLGELVHNPVLRDQLRDHGIAEGSLHDIQSKSRRVMITAHGASDVDRERWKLAGFDVADGTCPLVHHAHQALKRLIAAGYSPVVVGKPGHAEVEGLTGDFPEAVVLSSPTDVARLSFRPRYGIISQTTQPIAF